jgi:hypothetical protein
MKKIVWTDRVRNEEVLRRFKEERNILYTITIRKAIHPYCAFLGNYRNV